MSSLRGLLKKKTARGTLLLLAALAVAGAAAGSFLDHRRPLPVKAGPGVTKIRHLRDYFGPLAGTRGDSEVFLLAGKEPGGTVLILGGTHPNEPSGHLAAITIVENAAAEKGRLFVIPRANASGFTAGDPQEASPQAFSIDTPSGKRWFRYGSRGTSPMDQWPDPDIYLHYPSGQTLSGNQTRNLNRAFPGRPDGNFTERVAFAITELVRREKVDLVIDLHEASPEYPVIHAIVAHERAMPLAVAVVMNLEMRGIKIALEPSPKNLHGLTHRELGDHTAALAVLMETANPAQGRLRGRTTADLIVKGRDKMYVRAAKAGRLFVEYDEGGHPLENERVARHLAGIEEFLKAFQEANPGKPVELRNFPVSEKVAAEGLGPYLR
ncbi:MAG TPA: succinylglutamate desuccinylase/aspartoacylase family protein [Syntrophales bacterium]|nr:succinylglutamate desuccinylase/aspartoacylase family protein [Syntrophales bacterium]